MIEYIFGFHLWLLAPYSPITLVISSVTRIGRGPKSGLSVSDLCPLSPARFSPQAGRKNGISSSRQVMDICSYSLTFFCFPYVGGMRQGLMYSSLVLNWLGRLVLKTWSSCRYLHLPGARLADIFSQAQLILKSFDLLG